MEGGGAPLAAQEVPTVPTRLTIGPVIDIVVSSGRGLLGRLGLFGTSLFRGGSVVRRASDGQYLLQNNRERGEGKGGIIGLLLTVIKIHSLA